MVLVARRVGGNPGKIVNPGLFKPLSLHIEGNNGRIDDY